MARTSNVDTSAKRGARRPKPTAPAPRRTPRCPRDSNAVSPTRRAHTEPTPPSSAPAAPMSFVHGRFVHPPRVYMDLFTPLLEYMVCRGQYGPSWEPEEEKESRTTVKATRRRVHARLDNSMTNRMTVKEQPPPPPPHHHHQEEEEEERPAPPHHDEPQAHEDARTLIPPSRHGIEQTPHTHTALWHRRCAVLWATMLPIEARRYLEETPIPTRHAVGVQHADRHTTHECRGGADTAHDSASMSAVVTAGGGGGGEGEGEGEGEGGGCRVLCDSGVETAADLTEEVRSQPTWRWCGASRYMQRLQACILGPDYTPGFVDDSDYLVAREVLFVVQQWENGFGSHRSGSSPVDTDTARGLQCGHAGIDTDVGVCDHEHCTNPTDARPTQQAAEEAILSDTEDRRSSRRSRRSCRCCRGCREWGECHCAATLALLHSVQLDVLVHAECAMRAGAALLRRIVAARLARMSRPPRILRLCRQLSMSAKETCALTYLLLCHCGRHLVGRMGSGGGAAAALIPSSVARWARLTPRELLHFLCATRPHMKQAVVVFDLKYRAFVDYQLTIAAEVMAALTGQPLTAEEQIKLEKTTLWRMIRDEERGAANTPPTRKRGRAGAHSPPHPFCETSRADREPPPERDWDALTDAYCSSDAEGGSGADGEEAARRVRSSAPSAFNDEAAAEEEDTGKAAPTGVHRRAKGPASMEEEEEEDNGADGSSGQWDKTRRRVDGGSCEGGEAPVSEPHHHHTRHGRGIDHHTPPPTCTAGQEGTTDTARWSHNAQHDPNPATNRRHATDEVDVALESCATVSEVLQSLTSTPPLRPRRRRGDGEESDADDGATGDDSVRSIGGSPARCGDADRTKKKTKKKRSSSSSSSGGGSSSSSSIAAEGGVECAGDMHTPYTSDMEYMDAAFKLLARLIRVRSAEADMKDEDDGANVPRSTMETTLRELKGRVRVARAVHESRVRATRRRRDEYYRHATSSRGGEDNSHANVDQEESSHDGPDSATSQDKTSRHHHHRHHHHRRHRRPSEHARCTPFEPRMEQLARRLGLSAFETQVLLLMLGNVISHDVLVAINGRYVMREGQRVMTVGFILFVLCDGLPARVRCRRAFYKSAPLIAHGIVALSLESNSRSCFDTDLMDYLCDIDRKMVDFLMGVETETSELVPGSRLFVPRVSLSGVVLPAHTTALVRSTVTHYALLEKCRRLCGLGEQASETHSVARGNNHHTDKDEDNHNNNYRDHDHQGSNETTTRSDESNREDGGGGGGSNNNNNNSMNHHNKPIVGSNVFSSSFGSSGAGLVLLFHGPSGTGKTMLANAVAHEVGKQLLLVNVSQFRSEGKVAEVMRFLFREAKLNNAVVFFDECESLFESRESNPLLTGLLAEFERYDGLVILATNKAQVLDEAMNRRVSLMVEFTLPDYARRAAIWRAHLPTALAHAADLCVDTLALNYELSGGMIRNAVHAALGFAVAREASASPTLTMADCERGARRQLRGFFLAARAHPMSCAAAEEDVLRGGGGGGGNSSGSAHEAAHITGAKQSRIHRTPDTRTRETTNGQAEQQTARAAGAANTDGSGVHHEHRTDSCAPPPLCDSGRESANGGDEAVGAGERGSHGSASASPPPVLDQPDEQTICAPALQEESQTLSSAATRPATDVDSRNRNRNNGISSLSHSHSTAGHHPAAAPAWRVGQSDGLAECYGNIPTHSLDELVTTAANRHALLRIVHRIQSRATLIAQWGFTESHCRVNEGSVLYLFYGPRGTGKSLAAEGIAAACHLTLRVANLAEMMLHAGAGGEAGGMSSSGSSSGGGGGSSMMSQLSRVFDEARQLGAMVVMDQAEVLFAHTERSGEVGQLIQYHAQFVHRPILLLATTGVSVCYFGRAAGARGRTDGDEAAEETSGTMMAGSLDVHAPGIAWAGEVRFGMPGAALRERLWRCAFPPRVPLGGDVDFRALSRRAVISGKMIRQVAFRACCRAAMLPSRQVTMILLTEELEEAVTRERSRQPLGRMFA